MLTNCIEGSLPALGSVSQQTVESILLLASASAARSLSTALQTSFNCDVLHAAAPDECDRLLLERSFSLVLVEDSFAFADDSYVESLYHLAGTAIVLEMNSALANPARIMRSIRAARERRRSDMIAARAAALQTLRAELSASLTGLLLEAELALHSHRAELAPVLSNLIALCELLYRGMQP